MIPSRHIGRVGALAVALGIGAAVTATPWAASAEPSDPGSSQSSRDADTSDTGAASNPTAHARSTARRSTRTTTESSIGKRTSAVGAPATKRVKHRKAGAEVISAPQPIFSSPGSSRHQATDTNASRAASDSAPELLRTNEIDAAEVVRRPVWQRGAEPSALGAPEAPGPIDPPTMWTLAAVARRELATVATTSPTKPPARRFTDRLVGDTGKLDRVSITPVIARDIGASTTPGLSDLGRIAQPTAEWPPAAFTGQPSVVTRVLSAVFSVVGAVGTVLHVDLTIPLLRVLTSAHPPRALTRGLDVERAEFEGMAVWALQTSEPVEKYVVALHGGADVLQPAIFSWLNYAAIARDTGATVIVPIYRLVQQGGTAGTVVPAVADLIMAQIDQHGSDNVSVHGDSAGGAIALAAVQELVRRGGPVPSHMVLSSPALDATLTNPAIHLVRDPVLSGPSLVHGRKITQKWAGDLDPTDPLVSPLYGSLAGLPPTAVYAGSRDVVAPDVLLLQDKALTTAGADFTFVLRKGEFHDWALFTILPETRAVLPDIYRQLGLANS